jgi:hypothetical protein
MDITMSNDKTKDTDYMSEQTEYKYRIDLRTISELYNNAWNICGFQLDKMLKNKSIWWFKSTIIKRPSFNDFCFMINNNIFAVLIEITESNSNRYLLDMNSNKFFLEKCLENDLVPCLFQMLYNSENKSFAPISQRWTLIHAITKKPIVFDNFNLRSNIKITNWELYDWAVSVVIDYLRKDGMKILSFSDVEEISPSIWFVDKENKLNWVVVRYFLFPEETATLPNIKSIQNNIISHKDEWAAFGFKYVLTAENPFNGFFAPVGFAKADGLNGVLFRGDPAHLSYKGLINIERFTDR